MSWWGAGCVGATRLVVGVLLLLCRRQPHCPPCAPCTSQIHRRSSSVRQLRAPGADGKVDEEGQVAAGPARPKKTPNQFEDIAEEVWGPGAAMRRVGW